MTKYVFFWGHTPKQQGVIDKSCLSQWYPAPFEVKTYGLHFETAEQFMMFAKAILFEDEELAKEIAVTTDPKKAKALGRRVKGFDQQIWDEQKESIVYTANFYKFSQNKELRKFLLSFPDDVEFVEASPYDRIWGIGLKASDPRAQDKSQWLGENLLGKALTKTRKRLIAVDEFLAFIHTLDKAIKKENEND